MRQLHDGLAVDGRDAVAHPHHADAVRGAALDDTADLVRYNCKKGKRGQITNCSFACSSSTINPPSRLHTGRDKDGAQ